MCLISRTRIWYFICHYYGPVNRANMYTMMRLRRALNSRYACGILCVALSLAQGCAHPEPLHPTSTGSLAVEDAQPAVSPDPKLATGLPFRALSHPRVLPAGTLLTVQLEDSLSTARVRAGDAFTASVAAPVTIDGETLIERGAAVTGHVESAQSQADRPGLVPGSGYFRLSLNAITVEGRQLALRTSSLFARGAVELSNVSSTGSVSDLRSVGVQVQKGRLLTFRLTAPVMLNDPNSMADRESRGPIPE